MKDKPRSMEEIIKEHKEEEKQLKLKRAGNVIRLCRIGIDGLNAIKKLYPTDYNKGDYAITKYKLNEDILTNRKILKDAGLGLKERRALEKGKVD